MKATVTYHRHSGFSVEIGEHLLLFDYWRGGLPIEAVEAAKYPIVFASHSHHDHYNEKVLELKEHNEATRFIFSDDIDMPEYATAVKPMDVLELGDVTIRTFDSTDEGVSFWVETEGVTIFHAGDLNFWHWRDERGEDEIAVARQAFEDALEPIVVMDMPIDIALFPVDMRLGTDYAEGARVFLERCDVKHFFPMHMWDRVEAAESFAKENEALSKIYVPKENGMTFELEL